MRQSSESSWRPAEFFAGHLKVSRGNLVSRRNPPVQGVCPAHRGSMPQFVRDVEDLRDRARQRIEEGPVTNAYQGDKDRTISILNEALATEIVCVLRYMHHYFMATGVHGKSVADEFKEHADAERDHADQIAERVQQRETGLQPEVAGRALRLTVHRRRNASGHDPRRLDRRARCD